MTRVSLLDGNGIGITQTLDSTILSVTSWKQLQRVLE